MNGMSSLKTRGGMTRGMSEKQIAIWTTSSRHITSEYKIAMVKSTNKSCTTTEQPATEQHKDSPRQGRKVTMLIRRNSIVNCMVGCVVTFLVVMACG